MDQKKNEVGYVLQFNAVVESNIHARMLIMDGLCHESVENTEFMKFSAEELL